MSARPAPPAPPGLRGYAMPAEWAPHVGTWIAWRVMRETSEALVDNLRVVFPGETAGQLRQRALATLRSYARNVIDFLCAVNMPGPQAKELLVLRPADYGRF